MHSTTPLRMFLRSPTVVKIIGTTVLTLVLLIPLNSIENLVEERSQRQREVTEQLQQQWGPAITIRGPILAVPTRGTGQHRYLLPDQLQVQGSVPVVERYRGIFKLPTYRGQLTLSGEFSTPDLEARIEEPTRTSPATPGRDGDVKPAVDTEAPPRQQTSHRERQNLSDLAWEQASWVLLVGPSSAAVQARVTWENTEVPLQVAHNRFGISTTMLHAPLEVPPAKEKAKFTAKIEAFGSDTLHIAPLGKEVGVMLSSDWPHPSFDGARLPTDRTVDDAGFRASWDFSASLLGVMPGYLGDRLPAPMAQSPTISVRFLDAISHYQQVTRGVKYALLVIVLTFVAFFLFEVLARLNIHPVQYLLVGCALILFYLLLLSLTEHLSFAWSYLIAASAVVLLIASYARAMLATAGRAAIFACGLGVVYGLLYIILKEETLALLAGSWALFALLAALMFLTRRVDWASFGRRAKAHSAEVSAESAE
ncbi:cell envelope integrity protein CreD [Myxococcota bacterium]